MHLSLLALLRGILAAVSLVVLTGCTQAPAADRDAASATGSGTTTASGATDSRPPSGAPQEIGFVVVGDSLTAGTEPLEGDSVGGTGSWVPAADDPPVEFLGGWAVPGATTAAMLEGVGPMRGDVLVLMAGTNDLLGRHETAGILANLAAIVDEVGVRDVLLSAVGPIDGRAAEVTEYNRQLETLAADSGWRFVDPWGDAWDDGSFVEGASDDGLHPVPEYADRVGREIRTALLADSGT